MGEAVGRSRGSGHPAWAGLRSGTGRARIVPASSHAALGTPRVRIEDRALEGLSLGPVDAFLGIPYAAPPVGDLRFLSPRRHTPWKGVRLATSLGHPCPQINADYPAWQDPNSGSEDCLVLNVWAPTRRESALPVMAGDEDEVCM